jgi:hypothetical protein
MNMPTGTNDTTPAVTPTNSVAVGKNAKPAADGTGGRRISLGSLRVNKLVSDALTLSNFAISIGAKTADGDPLPFGDIATIQTIGAELGELDPARSVSSRPSDAAPQAVPSITTDEWNALCLAYYRLATLLSPVTAETLRDTEGTSRSVEESSDRQQTLFWRHVCKWRDRIFGYSPALRFTRGLWIVAILIAVFVVCAEWRIFALGQEADVDKPMEWLLMDVSVKEAKQLLESLVPWAYGALGACAFLLRSAHTYIYRRCFDLRRKPEYFNRILLGAISGGAIILYTKYLVDQDGTAVGLGSAALGFIAGYSTDFLFNTIERIVTAIFPKVGMETVSQSTVKAKPADLPTNTVDTEIGKDQKDPANK